MWPLHQMQEWREPMYCDTMMHPPPWILKPKLIHRNKNYSTIFLEYSDAFQCCLYGLKGIDLLTSKEKWGLGGSGKK